MKTSALGIALMFIAALLPLASGSPAQASTFVYRGNYFTVISDSSLGNNITAYFVFDNSVNTSSGTLTDAGKILLWTVSTGGVSIDSATGTLENPSFSFYQGYITTWTFSVSSQEGTYTIATSGDWSTGSGIGEDSVSTGNLKNYNSDNPMYWLPTVLSLPKLQGTWVSNTMASAPAGPMWERDTMTVKGDGTFTGLGVLSNGHAGSISGAFMQSASGLLVSYGVPDKTLCKTDVNNTVFACTGSWTDGNPNLAVGVKLASSYELSDLAGTWKGGMLAAGQFTSRMKSTLKIKADGTFTGRQIGGKRGRRNVSGQFSISSGGNTSGTITCVSGCEAFSDFNLVLDSGKTIMVGTSTGSDGATPQLWVYAKKASSYSRADLAGTWELNGLTSGEGAAWRRETITVGRRGKIAGTKGRRHKVSVSERGAISGPADLPSPMYLDAGKSVIAYVDAPPRSAPEIGILTKNPLAVSGSVLLESGFLPGVTIKLVGHSTSAEAVTNASGVYSLEGLQNGRYMVKPVMPGYKFKPKHVSVTVKGRDITEVDFVGVAITISGRVVAFEGKKLGNPPRAPVIRLSGNGLYYSMTMSADSNGRYSFPGLANGVYEVTPLSNVHNNVSGAPALSFRPGSSKVTIAGRSVKQNFHYKTDSSCTVCH